MFGMLKALKAAKSFPVFCTLNLAVGPFTRDIRNSEVKTLRKALKKLVVRLIRRIFHLVKNPARYRHKHCSLIFMLH